jgi:hypothetical protein
MHHLPLGARRTEAMMRETFDLLAVRRALGAVITHEKLATGNRCSEPLLFPGILLFDPV